MVRIGHSPDLPVGSDTRRSSDLGNPETTRVTNSGFTAS